MRRFGWGILMHPLHKSFSIRNRRKRDFGLNLTGGFSEPDRLSWIYYDQLKRICKFLNWRLIMTLLTFKLVNLEPISSLYLTEAMVNLYHFNCHFFSCQLYNDIIPKGKCLIWSNIFWWVMSYLWNIILKEKCPIWETF